MRTRRWNRLALLKDFAGEARKWLVSNRTECANKRQLEHQAEETSHYRDFPRSVAPPRCHHARVWC